MNPATTADSAAATTSYWFFSPVHFPAQADLLTWCQTMNPGTAALLVLAGIVYLLFGYLLFKVLVAINAAAIGAYLGTWIGVRYSQPLAGGIVGAILAAAISWPLLKYAVALMTGIIGAAVGASIWRTVGLDPQFAWAGAMTGLVALGLLAFILFRGSIIMYTSLQGASMLVFGLLGLIYKYQEVGPKLTSGLNANALVMPMTILIPALLGFIWQQTKYPAKAPAGGPPKK